MSKITQPSQVANAPARPTLQAAMNYANAGVRVLPLTPRSKAACLKAWQTAAFTDHKQITQWFGNGTAYNIGMAMGEWQHTQDTGTYLVCVDIDMHNGIDGKALLDQLVAEHGALGEPFIADTATGGLHLVYQTTVALTNERGALPTGIDVRGVGGYIMTEPSTHPDNGRAPKWRANSNWQIAKPGLIPQWLLQVIQYKPEPITQQPPTEPRLRAVSDDTRPGDIYNNEHTWETVLANYGWAFVETKSDTQGRKTYWARPGKPAVPDAHSAVLTHDAGAHGVFTVFTTNAPHELMRPDHHTTTGAHYKFANPFDFYACMQHGGDHKQAAIAYGAELRAKQQPELDRLMQPKQVATTEPNKPPLTVVKSEPAPDDTPSGQSYKLQSMFDLVGVPYEPRIPDRLIMTNGRGLFYSNADNLVASAAATHKTFLSVFTCLQQIQQGKHVVIIDYEMNMRDWFNRFNLLGATANELKLVHYCAPDEALQSMSYNNAITTAAAQTMHAEIARIGELPGGLGWCVIDGITQGMTQSGLDYINNTDISLFWQLLPKYIVRETGAGVGLNDHIPKAGGDSPTPIGGQHKVATTSGAVHMLAAKSYLAKWPTPNPGIVIIRCIKDRHGEIGQGKTVAQAIFTPLDNGNIKCIVEPHTGEHDTPQQTNDDRVLQTMRECNEIRQTCGLNHLAKLHSGNNKPLMTERLQRLASQGKAVNRGSDKPGGKQDWHAITTDPDLDRLL